MLTKDPFLCWFLILFIYMLTKDPFLCWFLILFIRDVRHVCLACIFGYIAMCKVWTLFLPKLDFISEEVWPRIAAAFVVLVFFFIVLFLQVRCVEFFSFTFCHGGRKAAKVRKN